jgi:hypothetical protein
MNVIQTTFKRLKTGTKAHARSKLLKLLSEEHRPNDYCNHTARTDQSAVLVLDRMFDVRAEIRNSHQKHQSSGRLSVRESVWHESHERGVFILFMQNITVKIWHAWLRHGQLVRWHCIANRLISYTFPDSAPKIVTFSRRHLPLQVVPQQEKLTIPS